MSANGWVPLGNVAEIVMGQAPPSTDCNTNGTGTVFIRAGEFDDRRPVVREWTTSPLKKARVGDVLVCVVGATAGKVNESIDCAIGRSVAAVRPDARKLLSPYLYHFLRTQVLRLRAKSQGLAQGVITREMLQELPLPLPPPLDQLRIAEVLDRAEALRAKRRSALAQLHTLPQAIFLDTFGDPSANTKRVPMESLGDHLLFVTSGGRGWAKFYAPNGKRFIRSLDVQMNHIGDEDIVFVVPPENAEARRTRAIAGDVLLTITGSRIGRVAALPPDLDGSYVSQHVAILRANHQRIDPSFLSFFLSLEAGGQRQIAKSQYGQTKPGLNFERIQRLRIPVPPIRLQHLFARHVAAVENVKDVHHASLGELDALFASLQHRAFRGEL